jgi:TolB-like protein/class 3 adenylate cyclase
MAETTTSASAARPPDRRKLVAIVYADMVGYSRLIGLDDQGTLDRLRALRRELIDPAIEEHGGRIVQTGGDSLLIVFDSIDGAVRCAVEVQRHVPVHDGDQPSDRAIRFRIGINIGDAIADGTDLHGDAVNVAARLQAECPPGGICVSRSVCDHVHGRLDLVFDELGPLNLKNISRPVEALVLRQRDFAERRPARDHEGLPLPDKPSIAVLPFANLSGDPEQEYFVDGVVEDIITGLSRIKWLFVIARNSSFAYKGKSPDIRQVGRELGVRYVLEGSLRKLGPRVRITAQLIDASSAAHVWAERYDRAIDDIFELQDEITANVVGAIEPSLRQAEIKRAKRKRPDSLDAYDLYLRAMPLAATAMPEDADKALQLLERAVALDPEYAVAHALIAWCHEQRYLRGGLHAETRAAASLHARAAIAAGIDDAPALAMAGFTIGVVEHDYETAIDAIDRSLALSPSSALALGFSSILRAWTGDDATSIRHAQTGIRLSPYDPLIYLPYVGLTYAYYFTGRFDEALTAAGRASQANPRFSVPCIFQTAALASLGRLTEAAASARRLLELEPSFRIGLISSYSSNKERLSTLADALRRAGLPE